MIENEKIPVENAGSVKSVFTAPFLAERPDHGVVGLLTGKPESLNREETDRLERMFRE